MEESAGETLAVGARDVAVGASATSAIVHAYLVQDHLVDEPALAAVFALAAVALAGAAFVLSRPAFHAGRRLAALLFAALITAYPVVNLYGATHVDALGIATKLVEAAGLVGAVRASPGDPAPLASFDVIVGALAAVVLLSALGHTH